MTSAIQRAMLESFIRGAIHNPILVQVRIRSPESLPIVRLPKIEFRITGYQATRKLVVSISVNFDKLCTLWISRQVFRDSFKRISFAVFLAQDMIIGLKLQLDSEFI